MFANVARMLLSAIVLLLAVLLTPLIFDAPKPESAPVWSLRVLQTPDKVAVGDKLNVEIVLLRNGLPAQIEQAQPIISVLAGGLVQDEANPVLIVSRAIQGESTARTQRWLAEYTAVRPGPVRIAATLEGVDGSSESPVIVHAQGLSDPIEVQMPQVAGSGAEGLMPLYFGGILALSGLAAFFFMRRQRYYHQ